jgi:hypothetical protein
MSEAIENTVDTVEQSDITADAVENTEVDTIENSEVECLSDEQAEQVEEAIEEGATEEEVASMIKKFQLKIDGEEVEKEIDLSNEEELAKMLQLAEVSQKRMQEAAELRKAEIKKNEEIQDFINRLKENPREILEHLGHDVKNLAENILEDEVKKMEMSPEERKIQELQAELEKRKIAEEKALKKAEAEELERIKNQYAAEFEKDLIQSIESNELSQDPETVYRMSQYMRVALANNIDLSFNDIAPLVKNSLDSDLAKYLNRLSVAQLEKLLNKDKLSELITKKMPKKKKKVVPPSAKEIKDTAAKVKDAIEEKKRNISATDFFKNI